MDISYPPGSIVWVKLEGGRWWPGEVTDDPDSSEAIKGLRKQPLAVVKFFDEDCFHVVKSEQHIYPYDCDKKDEFLSRGKDFKMSGKDNFSLQLKFEADVSKAESLCKSSTKKSSPTNSTVITALRGAKYASYMKIPPAERFDYGENSEEKEIDWQPFVPRNEPGVARIRQQPATPKAKETMYSCDTCNFQTTRMDNFIRHHKSHSDPYRFNPGVESEPRYVYDKLKVKARKRVKDVNKAKKRTKKTDEDKKKINVTPKKRKTEEKERRINLKKRKLEKEKTPFSNPFEEEEEEKKKEKEVPPNDDPDADDADDLDEIDCQKLPETSPPPPVKWEEFIKGTATQSSNSNTQESEKVEADEDLKTSATYPIDENGTSTEQKENTEELNDSNEELKENDLHVVPKENDFVIETKENDLVLETKENDLIIEPKENDLTIEPKENDLTIELKENDLTIEPKENDLTIEPKENDLTIEPKEEDLITEPKEKDLITESKENDLITESKENDLIAEPTAESPIVEPEENELIVERTENDVKMEESVVECEVVPPIESQNGIKEAVCLSNEEMFPVTLLPMEQVEEMAVEEMSVQEEVTSEVIVEEAEIPSEEIVVTEASLHAGEMMVGEEIEVQEIEIQSDGLTGNEIVLSDEVVMHLLPEDRADADVLMDPMVPQNDQHISGVLAEGDSGSIFTPVYASDHSLMAAATLSKQINSSSEVYMEKECRENEESVQVCQAIDPDMNS